MSYEVNWEATARRGETSEQAAVRSHIEYCGGALVYFDTDREDADGDTIYASLTYEEAKELANDLSSKIAAFENECTLQGVEL